jgi:DNA-binding CsgD family transcriptional regulator
VGAARAAEAAATGLPFWLARAQLSRGLLEDEPDATLTEAWRTFRHLGADLWRGRTAAALRARRLPVPRARRTRAGGLSDLEREIVALVAEGLSNEDIARRLSYSKHSISAYVARIYAKTGCATRVDLVRGVADGRIG